MGMKNKVAVHPVAEEGQASFSPSNGTEAGRPTSPEAEPSSNEKKPPRPDLSTTVGAFTSRYERKKKRQKQADGLEEVFSKQRHTLLLQAMMNIRKSLAQVARIDLGERFYFSLDTDDFQGWPKLIIRLEDAELPQADYPFFQVLAHDRRRKAAIEIIYADPQKPESLSLVDSADLKRLPSILKQCVRTFLETVEKVTFEAEQEMDPNDDDDRVLRQKNLSEFEEAVTSEEKELSGDLFMDENYAQNPLESLPEMDEIESLPDTKTNFESTE